MNATALISAHYLDKHYVVTLVWDSEEYVHTCKTINQVVTLINGNGLYKDQVEYSGISYNAERIINSMLQDRPQPTMINCPDCGIERWSDETGPCTNCIWIAENTIATSPVWNICPGCGTSVSVNVDDNDCTCDEEKTSMKAIITVSNDAMHVIEANRDGTIFDNIIYFSLFPVEAVVAWAQNNNADLYFAPNCKRSFIEAIIKAMGNSSQR